MSGETEREVSGWTVDTLKMHLDSRISELRNLLDERYETQSKAVDAAFVAQQVAMRTALESAEKAVNVALISAEKAVTKAEVAAEKRFESVNEFRSTLQDQQGTFVTRNEVNVQVINLVEKIESLEKRVNTSEGRGGGISSSIGFALTTSAIFVTIIIAAITIIATR